jgi:hypothetical protein
MVVVRRIVGLEEENVAWKEIAAVAIFFSLELEKSDCPSSSGEELAALLERTTYNHWRYPVGRRKKMMMSGCSCCTDVLFKCAGSKSYVFFNCAGSKSWEHVKGRKGENFGQVANEVMLIERL